MRKFNVLTVLFLLFWVQICFAEDGYPIEIPDEIPTIYEFQFFDEATAPNKNYVDFGSGSCCSDCAKKNEVQGITSINDKYWILAKNKWLYVYKLEEDSSLFSRSTLKNQISNEDFDYDNEVKYGDIDFFDGHLYVPNGKRIDIYKWNQEKAKFEENPISRKIDVNSFGTAIHPYGKHLFYRMNGTRDRILGQKILDSETNQMRNCSDSILLIDGDGYPMSHRTLTDHNWTQGMAFSPNGRFLFFVHDDAHDENSQYTGIYVYYFDEENYEKFLSDKCYYSTNAIKAFLVGFKNIKYNPDAAWARLDELEGINVREIQGYDVHQLVLHNTDINCDEEFSVIHYKTGDYDKDGVKDIYDNCPFDWNRDQADWNGDGIGDVCQDYDKDGVKDSEDNCITVPNPKQEDLDGINGGDACDDMKDGDGWPDEKDPCPYDYNEKICGGEDCRFSKTPSDCCLEARKECDIDRDGRWDEEPYNESYPDFYDNYAFSVGAFWSKSGAKCEEIGKDSSKTATFWYESCDVGYELKINNRTSYFRNMKNTEDAKMSSYYCYCGDDTRQHQDCEDEEKGKCGPDHAHPGEAWNKRYGKPTWMPLYSNGEDYKDKNFADVVVKSNSSQKNKIQHSSFYTTWSYSKDNWLKSQITGEKNPENMSDEEFFATLPYAENEDAKKIIKNRGNYPKMKISHGAVFSDKNDYVKDEEINKLFFSNGEEYQKHITGKNEELKLASKSEDLDLIIENKIFTHGYLTLPGLGKWYWEMLRDYIGEKPWWMESLPFARQFDDIVKESIYESISRPSLFSRVSYDGEDIKVKAVEYPRNYNQIFPYAVQNGVYYQDNDAFKVAFSDENGIFENARTVHNGFEMRSAATAVKGGEIYMAAGMTVTPGSQKRNASNAADPAEEKPIRNRRFTRIYFTRGEAVMEELAELPWTPEYITLFKTNDRIHAMMMNANGETSILEYSYDSNSWTTLNTFNFGQVFSLNNTFVKDNKLYFTAPNAEGKTAFYTWDNSNSFVEIAHLDSEYDSSIKPFESAGEIILADLKDISGKSIDSWQLNGTIFEKEKISLDKPKFAQKFCLNETDNTIFPGITNFYGECVKVENYDFNEVTFPDYKLSVAGYKNSLYLGGLSGIRRVEIGENGEITKKEMIYSGESNNLAVYGNTLYAANYSEIDIFEIADDGVIQRKSSVKTSNCKNIRIDGGKLFAAENKRVRIFDLNDPRSPKLLKTISFSNTVEDLEIAENKLFVYENLNGLLTRKGKVSVFDVSDIATPQKIKEFSQYCNDPEMQKSGNSVYLGCKNGSFKVEETGLQKVNGSKNYLREGYVFDGILYQVFSGTLHESSVESDEIEEDGWL